MKPLNYLKLMTDNDISLTDLPKDIKAKINALKPTIARYNNSNPRSEALEKAIIKQDIGIAELIANYIEKDLPEEPEEVIEAVIEPVIEPVIEAVIEPIVEAVPIVEVVVEPIIEPVIESVVVVAPVVEVRKAKQGYSGTLEMEKQILEECKANTYISTSRLATILGKSEWGLSNSEEKVFSIVLRKVYRNPTYKLVE